MYSFIFHISQMPIAKRGNMRQRISTAPLQSTHIIIRAVIVHLIHNVYTHIYIYIYIYIYIFECCYDAVQNHDILYGASMTATEHKSDFKLTTYTPYLALKGELWDVFYENFEEDWPRYSGTALYIHIPINFVNSSIPRHAWFVSIHVIHGCISR